MSQFSSLSLFHKTPSNLRTSSSSQERSLYREKHQIKRRVLNRPQIRKPDDLPPQIINGMNQIKFINETNQLSSSTSIYMQILQKPRRCLEKLSWQSESFGTTLSRIATRRTHTRTHTLCNINKSTHNSTLTIHISDLSDLSDHQTTQNWSHGHRLVG